MTILIPNLAIAGYRSFGRTPQFFERFTKVNVFIGQNNAGKSNVLRFLHEVYSQAAGRNAVNLENLARNLPDRPPVLLGIGEPVNTIDPEQSVTPKAHRLAAEIRDLNDRSLATSLLEKLAQEKARIDQTTLCWTLIDLPDRKDSQESWRDATKILKDYEIRRLWNLLTRQSGGDRTDWEHGVTIRMPASPSVIQTELVPAIRQIGTKGTKSDAYDGTGIIERVAKLQNPDVHSRDSRHAFHAIRDFLRDVVGRSDAEIEVPYERDTILVHMDGKVLPIESLGSGIHEVLILAAAATTLSNKVVCIEEPELHLNPILQKKLLRYLSHKTDNQYFITTHSAALMDTPGAEIYHIRLNEGSSVVERVTSSEHKSAVCEDLGYHPSDLLQANCILWVEGPSDRIYLNWWLRSFDSQLIEGIHYSIMFYGGRLASHLSQAPCSDEITDFISLRRLNRRGVMLIDSDRDRAHKQVNATKRRLQKEFDSGPGHAWITEGREIENYLPLAQIRDAVAKVHPKSSYLTVDAGKYENLLSINSASGKLATASKVDVARHISDNFEPDFSLYDLRQRIQALTKFIRASNPKT